LHYLILLVLAEILIIIFTWLVFLNFEFVSIVLLIIHLQNSIRLTLNIFSLLIIICFIINIFFYLFIIFLTKKFLAYIKKNIFIFFAIFCENFPVKLLFNTTINWFTTMPINKLPLTILWIIIVMRRLV
jgi:hypothetical protein